MGPRSGPFALTKSDNLMWQEKKLEYPKKKGLSSDKRVGTLSFSSTDGLEFQNFLNLLHERKVKVA